MKLIVKLRGAVLTLLTGSALSQVVIVLASPVLTRLYEPAIFGEYATLSMVLSSVVVFATGKFELSVLLQTDQVRAWQAACLAMTTAVLVSTALFAAGCMALWLLPNEWTQRMLLKGISPAALLCLCLVMVLLNASQAILFALMNRNGQFSGMSAARIAQAFIMVVSQITLSFLSNGLTGLLLGTVLGLIACAAVQSFYAVRGNGLEFPNTDSMRTIAVANKNLPLHTIPTDLIGTLLAQFPVYFLAAHYSTAAVGFYSLAQRTLQAPMQLIANSIGEVFRRNASSMYAERGECKHYFLKISGLLGLLAVVGCVVTVLWAEPLFAWVFGAKWESAGSFAAIMIFMFALKFIVSPISFMFLIVKRTGLDLALHLVFLGILVFAFQWINPDTLSVKDALKLFVSIYSIMYIVYFFFSYRFAKGAQ
jgi:O-antigen/teichoic acid export membrane protein